VTMRCNGFAPVAYDDARALILGTLPGEQSLKCGECYAKREFRVFSGFVRFQ